MEINKVIACLKEIGFNPDVNNFEERIKIQKLIYLLNLKGIHTGFKYSLYVRGPYSTVLAHELYANKEIVEKLATTTHLSSSEKEKIKEVKQIFDNLQVSLLEVAATYAYFAYDTQSKLDPITATKKVKQMKNFYTETQIAIGISKAKELLYKPTEKELADIKKEHEIWQDASIKTM
jgi:uncharacterized protein YwgA